MHGIIQKPKQSRREHLTVLAFKAYTVTITMEINSYIGLKKKKNLNVASWVRKLERERGE